MPKRKRDSEESTPPNKKATIGEATLHGNKAFNIPEAEWHVTKGPLGIVTWNVNHMGAMDKQSDRAITHFQKCAEQYHSTHDADSLKNIISNHYLEYGWKHKIISRWLLPQEMPSPPANKRKIAQSSSPKSAETAETNLKQALHELDENKVVARLAIIDGVAELFQDNRWLHAVVLQEVNKGMERLHSALTSIGLECHAGPVFKTDQGNQYESYPIIFRKNCGLRYSSSFIIPTTGNQKTTADFKEVSWNKHVNKYRPVVVHKLSTSNPKDARNDKASINIAVVHTTPGKGNEFDRRNQFTQIKNALKKSGEETNPEQDSWIFCGDFYLAREARVVRTESLTNSDLIAGLTKLVRQRLTQKPKGHLLDIFKQERNEAYKAQDRPLNGPTRLTKTSMEDFLRNIFPITFEHQLPAHLSIAQPVYGTNWHGKTLKRPIPQQDLADRAKYFATARVADIFLFTHAHLSCLAVGMVRPKGGLALADTEDLQYSKYWNSVSDHFPVAALFALQNEEYIAELEKVLLHQEVSVYQKQVDALNERRKLHIAAMKLLEDTGGDEKERSELRSLWMKKTDKDLQRLLNTHEKKKKAQEARKYAEEFVNDSPIEHLDFGPDSTDGSDK